MALTDAQVLTASIATWIGGSMSIFGSSLLIYILVVQKRHKEDGYHRLLLGLSICDLLSSLGWIAGPIAIPREGSDRLIALGSMQTCEAAGFMVQAGSASYVYNAMLSVYFVLVIRYGITARTLIVCEYVMHILTIGFSVLSAIAGLVLGLFNEVAVGIMCWIAESPVDCGLEDSAVECTRGDVPLIYVYLLATLPLLSIPTVVVCNILIYYTVRKTENDRQKHDRTIEFAARQQQYKRTHKVMIQAFLFVAAFLNCIVWAALTRNLDGLDVVIRDNESTYFILILLSQFFAPFQGMLNLIVYLRPRYLRIRERFNYIGRIDAFRMAVMTHQQRQEFRSSIAGRKSAPPSVVPFHSRDEGGSFEGGCVELVPFRQGQQLELNRQRSIEKIILLEDESTELLCGRKKAGWKHCGEIEAIRVI